MQLKVQTHIKFLYDGAGTDCSYHLPALSCSISIATRQRVQVILIHCVYPDNAEAELAPDPKRTKVETAADAGDAATDGTADTAAAAAAAADQPSAAMKADGAAADTAVADKTVNGTSLSEDVEGSKEAAEASQPSEPTVLAFRCC